MLFVSRRRTILRFVPLVLTIALVLAACGGGGSTPTTAPSPTPTQSIATGRIDRGFLGVSVVNVTAALTMNFDLPVTSGVVIVSVAPGSPAEQSGLRTRDVIVRVARQSVSNPGEFDRVLIRYGEGASVDVEFFRGEQQQTVTVALGARPR